MHSTSVPSCSCSSEKWEFLSAGQTRRRSAPHSPLCFPFHLRDLEIPGVPVGRREEGWMLPSKNSQNWNSSARALSCVSLHLSSLPFCSAQEFQAEKPPPKKQQPAHLHTHARKVGGLCVTAHMKGGVQGEFTSLGKLAGPEGGASLSGRRIPDKSSCPLFPLLRAFVSFLCLTSASCLPLFFFPFLFFFISGPRSFPHAFRDR